jgi:hypothetical protein
VRKMRKGKERVKKTIRKRRNRKIRDMRRKGRKIRNKD